MLNTRVEKNKTPKFEKKFVEKIWAEWSRNKQEIKNKKNLWTVAPVFEHEQIGFCGILENYSSFCTRKRVCN